jgi:DNA-directed RNA polymerase specialized sigma24 family protein
VRNAVLALAEADREILLLRDYEGLSNQEAAQVLQLSISAASQRYGRIVSVAGCVRRPHR